MNSSHIVESPPAQSWNTPLNSLRAFAVLSFACVLISLMFPATQRFLAAGSISISGLLTVQLFKLKGVEEKPDPRERDITTLGLGNF